MPLPKSFSKIAAAIAFSVVLPAVAAEEEDHMAPPPPQPPFQSNEAIDPATLKLAPNVKVAPGYVKVTEQYVTTNATNIRTDYLKPIQYEIVETLPRKTTVSAMAMVKSHPWILVEKDGVGIGYISLGEVTKAQFADTVRAP